MINTVVLGAENVSQLRYWLDVASLIASIAAPIAMFIALAQYISTNRASARAHMHSVFRDYLALRATAPARSSKQIMGYRYYAMEEALFWVNRQGRIWNPASWISENEKEAWLATIAHHIEPDKGGEGHRYFHDNRKIFGLEFQKFCDDLLGPFPKTKETEPIMPPDAPEA